MPNALPAESVAEIPVNPDVLKWARKLRGLSLIDAAERLEISVSELEDYENAVRLPTLTTLQRIATKYQINYVSLFMPEPLPIEAGLTDRRTRKEHAAKPLTLETRVALQEVADTLDMLADLRADAPDLFRAGRLEGMLKGESAADLAIRQRKKFAVSIKTQKDWTDAAAVRGWRRLIESRGVFVYLIPMGDECSGATIERDGLYGICVNDSETVNGARIFTMFHEYCHVLRRQTGISDERRTNPIERYCNEFAAAFLVPFTALDNLLGAPTRARDFDIEELRKLASTFNVSLGAMAVRLEESGWAVKGTYDKVFSITRKGKPRKSTADSGDIRINPVVQQARRLGARHTKITLDALGRGVINSADARDLLRIEPPRFASLRAAVE